MSRLQTSVPQSSPALKADRPVRLALSLGDPAGIGPEIILKTLAALSPSQRESMVVVGDRAVLTHTYDQLRAAGQVALDPDAVPLVEVALDADVRRQITLGQASAASGDSSFHWLRAAIAHTLDGHCDGVVTAPIAKSAWAAAGHRYPGQTEVLAEMAGVSRFGMMFVARSPHTGWLLRTLLATTHIPLASVPAALTTEVLTLKLDLLIDTLAADFGCRTPRIAIAGLNPHSGEQGQLGREEQDSLLGWLQDMRDRHPQAQLDGLLPPDTMWVKPGQAWFGTAPVVAHDAYLALYHDQGLIPVKLMAFDRAVNTTIGLPFIRTSPDHGTAFDIAGQGRADATSFQAAIALGVDLAHQRRQPA
jgi:4-hydroxythreonine-4-phosphate dehydrogenase